MAIPDENTEMGTEDPATPVLFSSLVERLFESDKKRKASSPLAKDAFPPLQRDDSNACSKSGVASCIRGHTETRQRQKVDEEAKKTRWPVPGFQRHLHVTRRRPQARGKTQSGYGRCWYGHDSSTGMICRSGGFSSSRSDSMALR